MRGIPAKLGSKLPKLDTALGAKPRPRLSLSDSSSPQRGQKAAADTGVFKPRN